MKLDGDEMVTPSTDVFKTSDTALAAYLISEGFNSPDIEYNGNNRASFVFNKTNPEIDKCISDFDTARATGNIVLFFNAYQALLRRIKERY
jgi:hypothetical protein